MSGMNTFQNAAIILGSKMTANKTKRTGNSSDRDLNIAPPVLILGFNSRPFYVIRLVVAFVIDAIQCKPFRAISNIGKKILERITPSLAYGNAPAAVISVGLMVGVFASSNHIPPRVVNLTFPTPNFALGVPMLCIGDSSLASARLSVFCSEFGVSNDNFFTTFTAAQASSDRCSVEISNWIGVAENYELAECLSDDVYCARHNSVTSLFLSVAADQHQLTVAAPFLPFPSTSLQSFSKCIGSLGLSRKGGSRSFWFPATARLEAV